MANTLTGLYPVMYNAMNTVSREMIGFIAAVSRDATAEQASKDQSVRSPVVPAMAASDIVATNIAATGADQTVDYVDITISKSRKVPFHLTGEEERGLGSANATIAEQRFAQAFRTLANEVETDLAATYVAASRAYGAAGTTPFGTGDDLTDLSEVMRILDDNGAPSTDRHAVLGSGAVAKLLGKQPAFFRVNEAGDDMARRFGVLEQTFGAAMHHSGQIKSHTKGTGTSYQLDAAAALGATALSADTGTGTILAGDVVTLVGDANKYVVATDAVSGDFTIGAPGLRSAVVDNAALAIGNNYVANMAFSRDAIQLAARVPAVPNGGDQADDRVYITDPVSGLVFEVSIYRQYRQVTYEVGLAWGSKAVNSAHMALLLG